MVALSHTRNGTVAALGVGKMIPYVTKKSETKEDEGTKGLSFSSERIEAQMIRIDKDTLVSIERATPDQFLTWYGSWITLVTRRASNVKKNKNGFLSVEEKQLLEINLVIQAAGSHLDATDKWWLVNELYDMELLELYRPVFFLMLGVIDE